MRWRRPKTRSALLPEHGVLIGGTARRVRRLARLSPGEPLLLPWVERLADIASDVRSEVMEVLQACRLEDVDMIRSGSIILREVMRMCGMPYCMVSDNGIREGAILSMVRGERIGDGD